MLKLSRQLLIFLLFVPVTLFALTGYPRKITVQTGDTIVFLPFTSQWNNADANVSVRIVRAPSHGTLQVVPGYYDSSALCLYTPAMYVRADSFKTYSPSNYPCFRYVPQPGYTGPDTFTYVIRNSTDSTAVLPCFIRVNPPEPGNLSVLLVVNDSLLPFIQSEVNRLKSDLEDEGYHAPILAFPNIESYDNANAKRLWDSLVARYDAPGQSMTGAMLIGKLPQFYIGLGGGQISKESVFWNLSKWEGDLLTDSTLLGLMVGHRHSSGSKIYSSGYANIWVSRFWAKDARGRANLAWGDEAALIKRQLQVNHDYRTGVSRLPHTAFMYIKTTSLNISGAGKSYLRYMNDNLYPEALYRNSTNFTNPLNLEFKKGCELFDISVDGNTSRLSAQGDPANWRYTSDDLMNSMVSARVVLHNACHTGILGGITNACLLSKNSGCVLAMGPTDYCGPWPQFSFVDTLWAPHVKQLKLMGQGDRWGRAYIRSNAFLWSSTFFGDLSLKPKMGPSNLKPVITDLQLTKTGTLTWSFTATAADADGRIKAYDWYANGYSMGRVDPDSSGPRNTFSVTYGAAKVCTLRVEVVDTFLARDYATLILHTDTGLISKQVNTDTEGSSLEIRQAPAALSVRPNPFTTSEALSICFPSNTGKKDRLSVRIFDLRGRLVRDLIAMPANLSEGRLAWDGKDAQGRPAAAGAYTIRVLSGPEKWIKRATLLK